MRPDLLAIESVLHPPEVVPAQQTQQENCRMSPGAARRRRERFALPNCPVCHLDWRLGLCWNIRRDRTSMPAECFTRVLAPIAQLVYHLPKPRRDGRTTLVLSPLELIDALAALISPPRRHRHRYHGVLAPNSPLRAAVTAYGREEPPSPEAPAKTVSATDEEQRTGSPARYLWAMLLARLFEALPLVCPNCGANTCLPAGRCASSPSSPMPHPSSRSSWHSASHPGHPRSRLPADRRPGTRRPSRNRTATSSLSPSPSSNSISVSPGSRRLLREAVPSAFVLPPSGMPPSPLQRAASACNGQHARSVRHVSGP